MLCPFTPLTAQKMKIFLKSKKYLDTLSFNKSVPEIMIICFTVPEIWHMTDLIVIFQNVPYQTQENISVFQTFL